MPEHSHSSGGHYSDAPLFIGGCFVYQKPQFTKKQVFFNGSSVLPEQRIKKTVDNGKIEWVDPDPDKESDLGHETFVLVRKAWKNDRWNTDEPTLFSFCKTARKPYDLMVQACLILYKYYFPYVSIGSDGDMEDWEEAFSFIAQVLPHGKEIGTELLINEAIFEKAS